MSSREILSNQSAQATLCGRPAPFPDDEVETKQATTAQVSLSDVVFPGGLPNPVAPLGLHWLNPTIY